MGNCLSSIKKKAIPPWYCFVLCFVLFFSNVSELDHSYLLNFVKMVFPNENYFVINLLCVFFIMCLLKSSTKKLFLFKNTTACKMQTVMLRRGKYEKQNTMVLLTNPHLNSYSSPTCCNFSWVIPVFTTYFYRNAAYH